MNSPPGGRAGKKSTGSAKKKKKKKKTTQTTTNLAGKSPPGAGKRSTTGAAVVLNLGERRRVATEMLGQGAPGQTDVLDKNERRRAAELLAEVRGEGNEPGAGSYSADWSSHQSAFAKLQKRLDSTTTALDAESSDAGSNSGSDHYHYDYGDGGLLPGTGASQTSAVLAGTGSDGSDSGNSSSFMQEVSNWTLDTPSVVCYCHTPEASAVHIVASTMYLRTVSLSV